MYIYIYVYLFISHVRMCSRTHLGRSSVDLQKKTLNCTHLRFRGSLMVNKMHLMA